MKYTDELVERYPELAVCRADIEKAIDAIVKMYHSGNKLLLCGNGGSCADCEHIAGELLKGFLLKRPYNNIDDEFALLQRGVPAIPLPSLTGVVSAFSNDVDASLVYAQLALALGSENDILLGISTSGNSKNVVSAFKAARRKKILTVALTGESGGKAKAYADIIIKAPASETFKVQEYHLPIYHAICAQVEETLFGGENEAD